MDRLEFDFLAFFQDHLREGSGTLTLTNPGGMAAADAAADVAAASSAATYGGRKAITLVEAPPQLTRLGRHLRPGRPNDHTAK